MKDARTAWSRCVLSEAPPTSARLGEARNRDSWARLSGHKTLLSLVNRAAEGCFRTGTLRWAIGPGSGFWTDRLRREGGREELAWAAQRPDRSWGRPVRAAVLAEPSQLKGVSCAFRCVGYRLELLAMT